MTDNAAPKPRVSLLKKGGGDSRAPQTVKATQPTMPPPHSEGLEIILARNSFYQINCKRTLNLLITQTLFIIGLIFLLSRLIGYTDSRDYYFSVQSDGTLIVDQPRYMPVYTDTQITEWAQKAVTNTFTFGYYDHLMRLQESRNYFTTRGWMILTKAMSDVQLLARINAEHDINIKGTNQVIVARLRRGTKPEITKQGVFNGRYAWRIKMLIDVSFYDLDKESNFPWDVNILITRLPAVESRDGIGIDQFIARTPH